MTMRGHTYRVRNTVTRRVVWRGARLRDALEHAAHGDPHDIAQLRVSRYRWLTLDASNVEALLNPNGALPMERMEAVELDIEEKRT